MTRVLVTDDHPVGRILIQELERKVAATGAV